jgi:hypothetical protein
MEKRIKKIGVFLIVGLFMAMLVPETVCAQPYTGDADWYEVGTDRPPDSIYDDIYTYGKVGIGILSPVAGLDVRTSVVSATGGFVKGVNFEQTLAATAHNDALTALHIKPTFVDGGYLGVKHYGLIVESGKVGIGTTNPNYQLHVIGDASITGSLNLGVGTLYIDDTNNRVGINTTNPQYALEVHGDEIWFNCSLFRLGSASLWHRNNDNTVGASKKSNKPTNQAWYRIVIDSEDEEEDTYFAIAHEESQWYQGGIDPDKEIFWIRESGYVGVNVKDPTQFLHVNGSARIENHIYDSNNEQGTTDQILSTTPTGIEWVDAPDGDTTDELQNLAEVYAHDQAIGNAVQLTATNGDIRLYNDENTEMLFLDEDTGRIGIGTQTPYVKFHIVGGMARVNGSIDEETQWRFAPGVGIQVLDDSDFGGMLLLDLGQDKKDTVIYWGDNPSGPGPDNLRFMFANNNYPSGHTLEECMRITAGGNVGIGTTSPQNILDVEGAVAIGATYSGSSLAPSNGAIIEGNVGIGTNNPQRPLHVSNVMRLEPRSSAPPYASQGDVYMHDGTGTPNYPVLRVYDGTQWQDLW